MAMELHEFLDEVSACLDLENLPSAVTPRTSTGDGDIELFLAETPSTFAIDDSLSEDVEPQSNKSSGSETEMVSSTKKKKTTRERPGDNRRKKYRDRVNNERKELKQIEKQLNMQLRVLRNAKERKSTIARRDIVLSKNFWKDLAVRQKEMRVRSEVEQKQLVASIQSQASYIDNLSSALRLQQENIIHTTALDNLKWLRLKSSNSALYEIYTGELHEGYARINEVFQECGMENISIGSVNLRQQLNSNGDVAYVQYVYKQFQPFSFENTHKNLWKTSKMFHRGIDREIYEDTDDSLALKFRLQHTLATGSTVSILNQKLSRRFRENDRVVFMWKGFWEGEDIYSGIDVDETGWISVRPYSDGSRSGALVECCLRQVPASCLTVKATESAVKDFHEMMQHESNQDVNEINRTLDKLLLEDSLSDIERNL